jgi:hypothetical protein
MIKNDYVTAAERLTFEPVSIESVYNKECCFCGRTSAQVTKEESCSFEEVDYYSRTSESGAWFCHVDCYRDSNGKWGI